MSSAGYELGFWRLMNRAVMYGICLWGVFYCWPPNLSNNEFFRRLAVFCYVYVGWIVIGFVILIVSCIIREFLEKERGT